MSLTKITPQNPSSKILAAYSLAAQKAEANKKVKGADINQLIKKIKNSPEKLTLMQVGRLSNDACKISSVLLNQQSKKFDVKNYKLEHALNLVKFKLSAEARREFRLSRGEDESIPLAEEIITDKKTVRFKQIEALMADAVKLAENISDKADNSIDHPSLLDFEDQIEALQISARELQDSMASSAYLHNRKKVSTLTNLRIKLSELEEAVSGARYRLNQKHEGVI